MKYNEMKNNATIFGSNARAEDGFRGYRPEYSMQQAVLVPLGTIVAIFLSCLVVSLTRC
jgi:hypothetical protein